MTVSLLVLTSALALFVALILLTPDHETTDRREAASMTGDPYTDPYTHPNGEDPLAPARGLAIGVVIAVVFWLVVFALFMLFGPGS